MLTPRAARLLFREGALTGPTAGIADGFVQANLIVVPERAADDFEEVCARNPGPCPLLERLAPGDPEPRRTAPGADLRFDLPRYCCYGPSGVEEYSDLGGRWRPDAVAFLLGCSFTFEQALTRAGLVPRHVEEGRNVPMYRTNRTTAPAGPFEGPLVVSMRPVPVGRIDEAIALTAPFGSAHGAPVHHGDPEALGIGDLGRPDWGEAVSQRPGEVPVFWACGVTSQVAVQQALARGAIPWAIGHAPGHMFITDLPAAEALRPPPMGSHRHRTIA
jgi:uncharacterized protein YcsI (UPF0317 family)